MFRFTKRRWVNLICLGVLSTLLISTYQNCSPSGFKAIQSAITESSAGDPDPVCLHPISGQPVAPGTEYVSYSAASAATQALCDAAKVISVCEVSSNQFTPAPAQHAACLVQGQTCAYPQGANIAAPTGNMAGATVAGYPKNSATYPSLCGDLVTRTCQESGQWSDTIPLYSSCVQYCVHPETSAPSNQPYTYYTRPSGTTEECLAAKVTSNCVPATGLYSPTPPMTKFTSCTVTTTPPPTGGIFPLRVESGKRYLVDASNRPFLMVGDTGWSLEVNLSREDVVKYLDDRKAKGFNTVVMELMEYCFTVDSVGFTCGTPGKNFYGKYPFSKNSSGVFDFTKPLEDYWLHVDFVITEARKRDILLLITPAYVGYMGGEQGWYQTMVKNGYAALKTYGQWVARRYQDYPNILWVQGGDYNVPDKDIVRSVVNGMIDISPDGLHTYHGDRGTPALKFSPTEPWLKVNALYTWTEVASTSSYGALYAYKNSTMPFFLLEAIYENERSLNGQGVRSQAYQAVLSGATGQVMGNSPMWFFNSGWQTALNSEGSRSMSTLAKIFAPLKWWMLVPDMSNQLLPTQTNRVTHPAAVASDGSFAMIYFNGGSLSVNLAPLTGSTINAYWIDPLSGQKTTVSGSPFTNSGTKTFTSPGSNSSGNADWILYLD